MGRKNKAKKQLKPPPEIIEQKAPEPPKEDFSDSDDQFTDARSAPMTPQPNSPLPIRTANPQDDETEDNAAQPPTISAVLAQDADDEEKSEEAPEEDGDDVATPIAPVPTEEAAPVEDDKEDVVEDEAAPEEESEKQDEPTEEPEPEPESLTAEVSEAKDTEQNEPAEEPQADEDDDFGDDFDDFEEGGQDDDFDDFEEGFQQPQVPEPQPPAQPQTTPAKAHPYEIPDFDGLSPDEVMSTTEPHLAELYPPSSLDLPALPPLSKDSSIFLTPRSASLWSQLVAPPPLAPPDWIRSRTRRLFLVSLGVPVDLDEILPASKQKKLVLPSLNISSTSPRTSSDSRSASRLKKTDANASSTSVDTQSKQDSASKRRKGPPPEPELDLVAARYLCNTTDEALGGMTDPELKEHITKLEAMQDTSKDVLEYWKKRTDEKIGDREAFEGVIENLVKHARKVRK